MRQASIRTLHDWTDQDDVTDSLVDTSVAVALVLADHEGHEQTLRAVHGRRLGLAGHAWFETYSVLTRLPPGARRSPRDAHAILTHDFPVTRFLDADAAAALITELADLGIAGGSVYDGLVAATARAHAMPLLSRDRRASATYAALGVEVRLID